MFCNPAVTSSRYRSGPAAFSSAVDVPIAARPFSNASPPSPIFCSSLNTVSVSWCMSAPTTCAAFERRDNAGTLNPVLPAMSSNFATTSAASVASLNTAPPNVTSTPVAATAATPTGPSASANAVASLVAVPSGSLIPCLIAAGSDSFDNFAAAVSAPDSTCFSDAADESASLRKALKSASITPVRAIGLILRLPIEFLDDHRVHGARQRVDPLVPPPTHRAADVHVAEDTGDEAGVFFFASTAASSLASCLSSAAVISRIVALLSAASVDRRTSSGRSRSYGNGCPSRPMSDHPTRYASDLANGFRSTSAPSISTNCPELSSLCTSRKSPSDSGNRTTSGATTRQRPMRYLKMF